MARFCRRLIGLSLTLLLAVGCQKGPTKYKVTGRILGKDGTPATFSEKTYVTLKFVPEGDGDRIGARVNNAAGTFEVDLPTGRYRANLFVMPENVKAGDPKNSPPPPGKAESGQVYEITKATQIDIPLPK